MASPGHHEPHGANRSLLQDAADALYEFLWNERETFEPPRELLDRGFVAVETAADYDKLEQLTIALGKALGKADAE